MIEYPGRALGTKMKIPAAALLIILVLSGLSQTASAEIPHENYDVANPDLGVVVNLLNASIRASESSLQDLNDTNISGANQYLEMVNRVLAPADQILSSIRNIAGSYQNLTYLLPPFTDLYSEMSSFSSMEVTFLQDRAKLVTASQLLNLSDAELTSALEIIRAVDALNNSMNGVIDQMLVSADAITTMKVDLRQPFTPNNLTSLILQLRDLLRIVMLDINSRIHNGIPWGPNRALLVLSLAKDHLYLGEDLVGRGFLYYDGHFQSNKPVRIFLDANMIFNLTTRSDGTFQGTFQFTYTIAMNASMLGAHTVVATANSTNQSLTSDHLGIVISLMPTTLSIEVDKILMSIDETVSARATLKDVYNRTIVGALCKWTMDATGSTAVTDATGTIRSSWTAEQLGFGMHSLSASYDGLIPYASSASPSISVTVNIPTKVELRLFSEKFVPGYYVVGNGTLFANDSQRMPHQRITVYMDGQIVANLTTDSIGEFAFSIPSEGVPGGTHTLRAAFLHRDIIWRYSDAQLSFEISKYHQGQYPFFPFFPGWQTGPTLEIPYLFFGPNAYYTWLFMLLILGVIIKTLQVRKRRIELARTNPLAVSPLPDGMASEELTAEPAFSLDALGSRASAEGAKDPNSQIIWYYHGLIDFMRKKRRVTIADSMTHWEVAKLLKTLGYQKDGVERITVLFERAFYSGIVLSEIDAVSMSAAMTGLMAPRGGAASAG
jgi:hypothetical protein